jgi:glycine oxidase
VKKVDAIIIGQGLAGTCMAMTLVARGKSVAVIDPVSHKDQGAVNASRSAAGLFNPITGRKMVKTWMADQLFSGLADFYRHYEKLWQAKFYHEIPIYRPFQSVEDQNDWMGAEQDETFQDFIEAVYTRPIGQSHFVDPFGGLLLKRSGYLDIPLFLDLAKTWLSDQGVFIKNSAFRQDLEISEREIIYQNGSNNIAARWVIYCTGVNQEDDLWSDLRFRPVKGEWLTLDIPFDSNYILNRGVFMIPREGAVRVGATYDHSSLDRIPTDKGQKEILDRMHKIYTGEYRILDQRAGIRPATYDRKPFVGVHPDFSSVATLNGLGAKGVTLAPYFANHLADHLLDHKPLLPEVDVLRCF